MNTCILWFRKSLRLNDFKPLLAAAEEKGHDFILPLYILDPDQIGENFQKFGLNRLKFLIECLDDLNNQLSSRYNSKLIILNGKPLEIFENILRSSKKSITSLFCEYASEPWERKNFSAITDLFKQENPDTLIKSFNAVHTILDLNKTIASANFRKPKSMKDMERIFSSTFETNSDGFFAIDEPANAPIKIQPPPDLKSLGIPNSSPESHPLSIDELAEKISHHVGINLKSIKSYFIGGETEALSRWKLLDSLIIHRYGELFASENIVLVITLSKHRKDAINACHFLIDWLKTKGPFWKYEKTKSSGHWVEALDSDNIEEQKWNN